MKPLMRNFSVVGAAVTLGAGIAAAEPAAQSTMSEDECRAIWNTAAGRSDLGPEGAKPYIDSFESVDLNSDLKITNAEFKAGCKAGHVHKFRRSG